MNKTKIEWCDSTLNPVIGCTYGCDFCYARKMNNRFSWIKNFSHPEFFSERLKNLKSQKSQNIFMNSMSDIADWKKEWFATVWEAIKNNPQHNYLFLTKRPEMIYEDWIQFGKNNIWCGATGVDSKTVDKAIFYLNEIKGGNTFISIEPILNDVQFSEGLENINWVIIGAETGNRKGKIKPKMEWINKIINECDKYSVPIFMKESLLPIVGDGNMRRELPKELWHLEYKGE